MRGKVKERGWRNLDQKGPSAVFIIGQYGLEGGDLKKLQCFVSSDATLQREFRREEGEQGKR